MQLNEKKYTQLVLMEMIKNFNFLWLLLLSGCIFATSQSKCKLILLWSWMHQARISQENSCASISKTMLLALLQIPISNCLFWCQLQRVVTYRSHVANSLWLLGLPPHCKQVWYQHRVGLRPAYLVLESADELQIKRLNDLFPVK